jgi:hypothetical protein
MKGSSEHRWWWASSAVPYSLFWLVPTVGAAVGFVAANRLRIPVWSGFLCGEIPALALEARWRQRIKGGAP